ncbi:MAG: hypothetical protein P8P74_02065 [Crocinitomicaceae bacterium]|nr:hypothetical protein [Crocinitomicaceae bacterium]
MIRALLVLSSLWVFPTFAQRALEIQFDQDSTEQGYSIETLRFYLSNIRFHTVEGVWHKEENSFNLIDIENPSSQKIPLPKDLVKAKIDSVSFLIGIDSTTNVAGILEGDLDPIKGMYWAWNSGYINFKVEGRSKALNTNFEYHLGGYLPPYASSRAVSFSRNSKNKRLVIHLSLKRFLDGIDMGNFSEVMIPGPKSAELSHSLSKCFSVE